MIHKQKRIVVMACCAIISLNYCYCQSPKNPDPPTPQPCCPEGYSKQGTASANSPKNPGALVGVKGDIHVMSGNTIVDGQTICHQWKPDAHTWNYGMSGGGDSDVCVREDPPSTLSPYGVTSIYSFEGDAPGTSVFPTKMVNGVAVPDVSQPPTFIFDPPQPTDQCQSYSLAAKSSEGDGDCNAGGESKESPNVTLKVWRCKAKTETKTGTFTFYFPCEGIGLRNIGYTFKSEYKDCNGEITTTMQEVAFSGGNLDSVSGVSCGTNHTLSDNGVDIVSEQLTSAGCGTIMYPPGTTYLCANTVQSFSIDSQVEDKLSVSCLVDGAEGACLPLYSSSSASVTLSATKCCP